MPVSSDVGFLAGMKLKHKTLIAGSVAVVVALGGVGVANAVSGGSDDGDAQATGSGADKAKAAAVALIPGGTSNAVERDSENGATWEVEVRKPDGSTVDVRLDANYQKVVIEPDSERHDSGD
jgi:uncharacterized membrane protein YkoI